MISLKNSALSKVLLPRFQRKGEHLENVDDGMLKLAKNEKSATHSCSNFGALNMLMVKIMQEV